MFNLGKLRISTLVILSFILFNGCSVVQRWSLVPKKQTVISDDGYPLITYKLIMKPDIFKGKPPRMLVFYIQGSGYETVLSKAGVLAGSTAMGASVVVLERRGVYENQNIDLDTCYKFSMKEVRIEDHLKVIREYLKHMDYEIPVIIMAAGEGGDIASDIAAREKRITHLILLGSGGGWSHAEELKYFLSTKGNYFDIDSLDKINSVFEDVRSNPDSMKMWAGHPYRRWNSYLWERPVDCLVKLDIPIFLAHGSKDESVPVESSRAVRATFDKLGKKNLTYKEYENANHLFVNLKDGLLLSPLIEVDLLEWFENLQIISRSERVAFEKRVKKAHPEFF